MGSISWTEADAETSSTGQRGRGLVHLRPGHLTRMQTPLLPDHLPDRPFTTTDGYAAALSQHDLTRLVTDGQLRRPFRGVYVPAHLPDSIETRARAAALVMSPHSVLCDRTAAWFHGVEAFRYAALETVPPLESFVLRGHDPTDRRECHGGTRDLRPDDWTRVAGVRVTTPTRTAVDLACRLPRREALAALDALARECDVTVEGMQRLLRRYRRRRGVVQARGLVPIADPRSESSRESWTRLAILDHGLPAPKPQWWVEVDGVAAYRLDLAYPRARVAVEYDGEEFHSSPADRAADRRRREWLHEHGWHVIVVTKDDFRGAGSDLWIRELRGVLLSRGVNLH